MTDAQKRANAKYRRKKLSDGTKKQINATLDTADYMLIDNYCKSVGISKAAFMVAAARYCTENGVNLAAFAVDNT